MALTGLPSAVTFYNALAQEDRHFVRKFHDGFHVIKDLNPEDPKELAAYIAGVEKLKETLAETTQAQNKQKPAEAPVDDDRKLEIYNKDKLLDSGLLMARETRNQFVYLYNNIYADAVSSFNPAIIDYLSEEEKQTKIDFFLYAFFVCYLKNQIDVIEHRGHAFEENRDNRSQCLYIIDRLNYRVEDKKEQQLITESLPSGSASNGAIPVAAGKDAGEAVGKIMIDIVNDKIDIPGEETPKSKPGTNDKQEKTKPTSASEQSSLKGKISKLLHKLMCAMNERRLYWVWGGSMLSAILATLPQTFYNVSNTSAAIGALSPYTGALSWALYYARGSLALFLLLKHTIAGPWMSPEERDTPVGQRFRTQWEQRKFSLLNDFIWATANLACYFFLIGSGVLGYAGNLLTAGLLVMDLCLTIWKFWEEETKHEAQMALFDADRLRLTKRRSKKEWLKSELETILDKENVEEAYKEWYSQLEAPKFRSYEIKEELETLKATMNKEALQILKKNLANEIDDITTVQLPNIDKMQNAKQRLWAYQKYGLINDLAYAAGLLLAFSVMCCLFCPPAVIAPAVAMIIGLAGAALCFTLGLAYAAISNGLAIAKTRHLGSEARKKCQELLNDYAKDMRENRLQPDDLRAKALYLEMKGLMAETRHQEKMVIYQSIELVRSLFIDACIPLLIFASLTFLPLGIGLGVLAAGFAVGLISNRLVNTLVPEKGDHIEFKVEEYQDFRSKLQACTAGKDVPLEVLDNQPKAKSRCFTLFGTKEATKEAGNLSSLKPI